VAGPLVDLCNARRLFGDDIGGVCIDQSPIYVFANRAKQEWIRVMYSDVTGRYLKKSNDDRVLHGSVTPLKAATADLYLALERANVGNVVVYTFGMKGSMEWLGDLGLEDWSGVDAEVDVGFTCVLV